MTTPSMYNRCEGWCNYPMLVERRVKQSNAEVSLAAGQAGDASARWAVTAVTLF